MLGDTLGDILGDTDGTDEGLPLGDTLGEDAGGDGNKDAKSKTTPTVGTPKKTGAKSLDLNVTTASAISIRKSAVKPYFAKGCLFQWYRLSTISQDEWVELPGAVHAAFQPSATEVGYKLRCIVTTVNNENSNSLDNSHTSSSSSLGDHSDNSSLASVTVDNQQENPNRTSHIFDTPNKVSADVSLFNGARQALARGATFGNLVGCGKEKLVVWATTVPTTIMAMKKRKFPWHQ